MIVSYRGRIPLLGVVVNGHKGGLRFLPLPEAERAGAVTQEEQASSGGNVVFPDVLVFTCNDLHLAFNYATGQCLGP